MALWQQAHARTRSVLSSEALRLQPVLPSRPLLALGGRWSHPQRATSKAQVSGKPGNRTFAAQQDVSIAAEGTPVLDLLQPSTQELQAESLSLLGQERSSALKALAIGLVSSTVLLSYPSEAWSLPDMSSLGEAATQAVTASGWLGPAVFVALYVAATVLLFPASVLTLVAGALYGPLQGTALVSLASTAGACMAFLVSRWLARPWVEGKIAGQPRFKAVLRGVAARGAWVVFLLRLSPLVPFNLLNYALGLTPVPFWQYTLSSWIGMLPGTFAYVYLGGAGRAAVEAAGSAGGGGGLDMTKIVLYAVGAVATIVATRLISNAAANALKEDGDMGESDGDNVDGAGSGGSGAK